MRHFLLLMILAAPGALLAHESEVFCNIKLQGLSNHAGIEVSVEPDLLWGYPDAESLAAVEETNGKFAKLTASGTGKTDANGALRLKVEFSFNGDGVRPTRTLISDRQQVEVEYCYVNVVAKYPGFRSYVGRLQVTAGEESSSIFDTLRPVITVRGSVIRLNDRTPVTELELQLSTTVQTRRVIPGRGGRGGRGGPQYEYVQENRSWTLKTDAQGAFMLSDETLPSGNYSLTPLGGKLAFSATSKAGRDIQLRDGDNDLGPLTVVPGGSLKLRLLSSEDNSPVVASCTLQDNQSWRGVPITDGVGELTGVIEGDYALHMRSDLFWETRRDVSIKAGEEVDLGDILMDPYLSLDIIALSDGDTGIERYTVTARMLEGERPPNNRNEFIVNGQLTAERTTLPRLRRGTWLITVYAEGHAKAEAEIELPTSEALTVTLPEGGKLSVTVRLDGEEIMRDFNLFAVRCDSEYYKVLTALEPDAWQKLQIDPNQRGVYTAERSWREDRYIDALAPGAYLVIAAAGGLGYLKRDNVLIERGETTTIELMPEPPTVALTLTRDGKPAAEVKLYLLMNHWNRQTESSEVTTDADGKYVHEFKTPGHYYVLTEREMEYLGKPDPQDWNWRERLRSFKGEGTELRYGQRSEVTIELNDSDSIWVTLKVKLPEGVSIDAPALNPKIAATHRRRYYQPKQVEGGWLYPQVPAGEYIVTTSVVTGTGERVQLTREIKVDTPPEQTIEIEFDIRTFTVSVEVPADTPLQNVQVQLVPKTLLENPDQMIRLREGRPDASRKVAFIGLEPGEYLVVALAWGMRSDLVACANRHVDSSKTDEVSITLTKEFGTLDLRVEGNPATGGRQDDSRWKVQFFNEMDEEVLPANPWFAFGSLRQNVDNWGWGQQNAGVRGVPAGRYRIVVSAYGLQPVEQQDVEIKAGETTKLTVAPSAAALLKLTLEGIIHERVIKGKAKATYLDAAGMEVDIIAPGQRLFTIHPTESANTCEAWLLNVMPGVAKIRIAIEGYEDIEVPIDFEPGKTILRTATAKARTD
ncbi:MAG: carboxypeptidase-like regulatory domain-containing protein [Planctomycetes bacterium]|nr:carboxypeptidase-like regulatory domain-containing protein [Planctomycetota bacterium]